MAETLQATRRMAVSRGQTSGNVYRVMAREHGGERDRKERVQRSSAELPLVVSDYATIEYLSDDDRNVTTGSALIRRFSPEIQIDNRSYHHEVFLTILSK